jgi:hypothetical protein
MLNKCFLLSQKLVVSGFVFLLILLTVIDSFQPQLVFANELQQPSRLVGLENIKSFDQKDLDVSEKQAKQASKKIFKGLDQAKTQVGDQQTRREAMDYGHDKASEKLKDLADRAKAADTPDDLNPADQMFLKNIQTQK